MSRKDTQFRSGSEWNGNAAGRPLGSKNKLSEDFLEALTKNFAKHGKQAIARVLEDSPVQYLKIVASLVPREFLLEVTQEEKPRFVINASAMNLEEWQAHHGLNVIKSPQQVTKENAIADQLIDQLKQET